MTMTIDRLAECDDWRQRDHIRDKPWMKAKDCGCRSRDGKLRFKCHRQVCNNDAQACGGYCPECFPRVLKRSGPRPEVVVLCGSTRFPDAFAEASKRLGLEGKIVLSVACFGHSGDLSPEECQIGNPTKDALDLLHKQKIDLADRVLVLNVDGYIGDSTRSEIEYAEWFEKPIEYLEPAK